MSFAAAGKEIIAQLGNALQDEAEAIMRESIQECPISDETTYATDIRTVDGKRIRIRDPLDPEGLLVGDNGTLRRSARVFAPIEDGDEISVLMGYGFGSEVNPEGRIAAAYAVPVHEITSARHKPPTKAKFLEDPLLAHAADMGAEFAARINIEDVSLEGVGATTILGTEVLSGADLGA